MDRGPESVESSSVAGRALRLSPSWRRAGGEGEREWVEANADNVSCGLFGCDFKTAVDSGQETFGASAPSLPPDANSPQTEGAF